MVHIKDPHLGNIYKFSSVEEEVEAAKKINEMVYPHNLTAEILSENIMSRGTQGDEPTYTRVVLLKGSYLDDDILQELSTKITNLFQINRVLIQII